jgi:branched-chain amino acid transport system substrate-binding protein
MTKNRLALLLTALILGGLLLANCGRLGSSKEIIIGAVLQLSGDNALWGENARKAINLLSGQLNDSGGIAGRKVVVLYEDSKGEPKTAVSALRKLVDFNRVPVVLGDMLSSTTLAMAPHANDSKTVIIGISCSSPAITLAGPYIYRVWPSDLYEGEAFADWAYKTGLRSVSIAFLNNDYGNGLRTAFARRYSALGGRIVMEEGYTQVRSEARNLATKLRSAASDAVYIVGYYEDSALILRELRQAGYKGKLLGTSSSIHEKLLEIAGSAANGFTAALVNDFDKDHLTPRQRQFFDDYKTHYGQDPDWAATHAGDAFEVAVQCLKDGAADGNQTLVSGKVLCRT